MAFENESEQAEQSGADDAGAGDLGDVLGNPDGSFVTAEKKSLSTGTLVMGGFILACGFGTYFMYNRNAPAVTAPPSSTSAQATITQFLSDDATNVNKMKDLLQNTEKAVEQFRATPGKKQVALEDLRTNPFRIAMDKEVAAEMPVDDISAQKRLAEERAATAKAAKSLQLQFVMTGKRSSCMINNVVYREGQIVDGFAIESIGANVVVVRKADARFQLSMKK